MNVAEACPAMARDAVTRVEYRIDFIIRRLSLGSLAFDYKLDEGVFLGADGIATSVPFCTPTEPAANQKCIYRALGLSTVRWRTAEDEKRSRPGTWCSSRVVAEPPATRAFHMAP
jgi:hypothetical protein